MVKAFCNTLGLAGCLWRGGAFLIFRSGSIGGDTPSCVMHWSLSLHAVIKNLRVVGPLLCNLCWCTRATFSQKDPDSRPCLQDCKTGDVADCVTHLHFLRWSIHLSALSTLKESCNCQALLGKVSTLGCWTVFPLIAPLPITLSLIGIKFQLGRALLSGSGWIFSLRS